MNDNKNTRPDFSSNEKKVWRPDSASPILSTADLPYGLPEGIYFIAIEEIQGAWVDGNWEEADGGIIEEWEETFIDSTGKENVKTVRKEIPRACRYVLKRFTETGFAENAFSSYAGPRKYKPNN